MSKKISEKQKPPRKGLLERREKILKAAAEVFAEKGIERATIDDIAERAGMGKGTIYRRVGKKEDLLGLLIQASALSVAEAIKSAIKKRSDPLLQFKEAINALCDFYENNLSVAIILVSELAARICYPEVAGGKFPHFRDEGVFGLFEGILKRAIQKGQIRQVDTHAVTKGLVRFLEPHLYQYFRTQSNYTKSEVAQFTIDLFLDGLRLKK